MRKGTRYAVLWLLAGLLAGSLTAQAQQIAVTAVDAVGMTVSELDRSVEFYSDVLSFEKVSEVEVWGTEYEHLQGVFGLRMRVARLQLGNEYIELTEYLTPKGRPYGTLVSRLEGLWLRKKQNELVPIAAHLSPFQYHPPAELSASA